MRSHSGKRFLSTKARAGGPVRARYVVAAIALLSSTAAYPAPLPSPPQQLTVAFTNAFPNGSVDSLTMPNPNSAAIAATNPLYTGGTPANLYTALTWVTNPVTSTLDLIYADAEQHKIWRLPGPGYQTPSLIFSWSGKGSGPPYPVGMAADSAGNVYVISPSSAWDGPGVWILPITAAGGYGPPLLIDHTFKDPATGKPVTTLALTEVLVAGTAATPVGAAAPAWNALDLLVLVADPLNTRVIRYSQAQIQSVLASQLPLQGPASTVVSQAQFSTQSVLKVPPLPLGMDIEQDPNTQHITLLFSTAFGRILDFDSAANAFVTPYAINLGLGLTRLRVGTFQNVPYVFVGQLPGQILEFAAPAPGGSNTKPFATVSKGVSNPADLAATTSGSTSAGGCIAPMSCAILPQLALEIAGPGIANIPPNAPIVADSCTLIDPRVTISDGVRSYDFETLDLGDYCPNMPQVLLSSNVFGDSGPTGTAIYAAKITASTLNQYSNGTTPINNTLTAFIVNPGLVTGSNPTQCPIANGQIVAWGPLPGVESTIPEGTTLIDISVSCMPQSDPPPAGQGAHPSIVVEGTQLQFPGAVGLIAPYIDGEFANLQTAFNQINSNMQIVDPTATVVPAIQGYITQSLTYFNEGVAAAAAGAAPATVLQDYNCALNTLWTGVQYVNSTDTASPGDFNAGPPPAEDENPAGTLLMRFDHLYYDVNLFAGNTPITTNALGLLASSVPACAPASSTLTASNPYLFGEATVPTVTGAAGSQSASSSYGTLLTISWTITGTTGACSLWDSDGYFFTSDSPDSVQGTGSYPVAYPPGFSADFPHSVTWTLSCPSLPPATAQYYVDSPGVLSLSLSEGSNTTGDGDVTLAWSFSDFPSGTQCSLTSSDPTFPGYPNGVTVSISASTPTPYFAGGGPGSFNTGTVGTSDPLTSGTGYYQYAASNDGEFTATLTCNGITSSTMYEIAE